MKVIQREWRRYKEAKNENKTNEVKVDQVDESV